MFTKLLQKIYVWNVKRIRKKQMTKRERKIEKKKQEFVKKYRELLKFVDWLNNKALKNRNEKKHFWEEVKKGAPNIEGVLQKLIRRYSGENQKTKKKEGKK